MSVPAPPYPSEYLGKTLVQKGGPLAVTSGATSSAFTFPTPFPDTNYQVGIEWVSGSTPGYGIRGKTVNYAYTVFTATTEASAFKWRAWRLP